MIVTKMTGSEGESFVAGCGAGWQETVAGECALEKGDSSEAGRGGYSQDGDAGEDA